MFQGHGGNAKVHDAHVSPQRFELGDAGDGLFGVGQNSPAGEAHHRLGEMVVGPRELFRSLGLPRLKMRRTRLTT